MGRLCQDCLNCQGKGAWHIKRHGVLYFIWIIAFFICSLDSAYWQLRQRLIHFYYLLRKWVNTSFHGKLSADHCLYYREKLQLVSCNPIKKTVFSTLQVRLFYILTRKFFIKFCLFEGVHIVYLGYQLTP